MITDEQIKKTALCVLFYPYYIQLTVGYVGCASTDSLRLAFIYISDISVFHVGFRKELRVIAHPAVVFMQAESLRSSALSLIDRLATLGILLHWKCSC